MADPILQEQDQQDGNVVQFQTSEEMYPYSPGAVIREVGKQITGGGITKDRPARQDQPYAIEGMQLSTTGEMADESIRRQTETIGYDEFVNRIATGEIPNVGTFQEGLLANDAAVVGDETIDANFRDQSAIRLSNAYEIFSEIKQPETGRPVAFGVETSPGQYDFSPSDLAKKDPKLKTIQQSIFTAQSNVAKIVRGEFSKLSGYTEEDQAKIENIFIRNLSTGTFWDTLNEKMDDDVIRGVGELVDLTFNYGLHAVGAVFETLGNAVAQIHPDYVYRGLGEQWSDGTERRARWSANIRNHILQPLGIKSLSETMNDMVRKDLDRQLKEGIIDQDQYDRLTTESITDAESGTTITGPRQFVSEEMAQAILTNSLDMLPESQEYAILVASNVAGLAGAGKARALKGGRDLDQVQVNLDKLKKAAEAPNASDDAIRKWKRFESMTPIQAGLAFKAERTQKRFNKNAAEYALGIRTADANIDKLSRQRDTLSVQMKDMRDRGVSRFSPEYKTLDFEYRRLSNMTLNKYITGRFVPNVKEAFKDAIPMSAVMYFAGEENSIVRAALGGDKMSAEGLTALLYIGIGKPVVTGVGKTAYWVNQQGGDLTNHFLKGTESILNLPFKAIGKTGIRGFLANRDMERLGELYLARTGKELPPETRAAMLQMQKLTSVLDEEGLDQVLTAAEASQTRINKIVDYFPAEEREEMTAILSETLAASTSMDWLRSVNRIDGINIDGRNLNSLDNISDIMQRQRVMTLQSKKTTRLIQMLEAKVSGRTDIRNTEEVEAYLASLREANRNTESAILNEKADLNEMIESYKRNIVTDPSQSLPPDIMSALDDMSIELKMSVESGVDQLNLLENQYQTNVGLLAERAEAAKAFRTDSAAHLKQVARNSEMVIDNRIDRMRRLAKRGFVGLDKKAREMGVTITINDMIADLMKYAPESDLQAMFGKNSRLFVGTLGKRMYTVANKMARRSLESMEGSSYDELYSMVTNKQSPLYIGDNPKPLDIVLYFMKNKDLGITAPEFKATPGEVMDVYAAFRDYAIRTNNDDLASRYEAYAGSVEDVIRKQAPEFFEDWKKARETFQAEWWDKLRVGGPLQAVHKSKNGPIKVSGKKTNEGETVLFDDIAIGEEAPEAKVNDRLFRSAYSNITPLDTFNRFGENIGDALAGKDGALQKLILRRAEIVESFTEGTADVFDISNPKNRAEFELLQNQLTELAYSRWGNKTFKSLSDPRLAPDRNVLDGGGYNWTASQDLDEVQNALTVLVRVEKGKPPVRMKLVDLGRMAEEEVSIENLIRENESLRKNASKFKDDVLSNLSGTQRAVTAKAGLLSDDQLKIQQAMGVKDPETFFRTQVLNGSKKDIDALMNSVRRKLGDTFTVGEGPDAVTYNTEEALNRGMANLLLNGMFQHAGVGPIPGSKYTSPSGVESPLIGMNNPEQLLDALQNRPQVKEILQKFMPDDHIEAFEETLIYLNDTVAFERGALATAGKVENLTKAMGVNALLSRSFNLARGMVSPQYVAAEFAVSLASHAGVDMLKLAARNEEANDIILKMMKYPRQMTKADVATFQTLAMEFIVTELGAMGKDADEVIRSWYEENPDKGQESKNEE